MLKVFTQKMLPILLVVLVLCPGAYAVEEDDPAQADVEENAGSGAGAVISPFALVEGGDEDGQNNEPSTPGEQPTALPPEDPYSVYPIAKNNLLAGRVIYLDPGHGAGGGGGAAAGYVEHEVNLILANLVKANLELSGATVRMTRSSAPDVFNYARMSEVNDYTMKLCRAQLLAALAVNPTSKSLQNDIAQTERLSRVMQAIIANNSLAETYYNTPYDYSYSRVIHADLKRIFEYSSIPLVWENNLFVSIHTNAAGNSGTSGSIAYYLDNNHRDSHQYYTSYPNVAKGKSIAELLAKEISAAAQWPNHGTRVNDFFMLREHNLPAALIEVAYHTNSADKAKLLNEKYQKRIATAITIAIQKYFAGVPSTTPLQPTHLVSGGYSFSQGVVGGIEPGVEVSAFLGAITPASGYTLRLVDSTGAPKTDGLVSSGDYLQLLDSSGAVVAGYALVIRADVNADGAVSIVDLLMLQKYLLGLESLTAGRYSAADASADGVVSIVDLLKIQKALLGLDKINQR